ncbi:MAG: RodZ domain-containing protein [Bacillota bacterium]
MSGLGRRLKDRRQSLGLSIKDIEEITKIRPLYIEALENEKFSVLPGKVYIIGFLRSYAKALKLDPKEIIEEFHNLWNEKDEEKEKRYEEKAVFADKAPANITLYYNKLLRFGIIILAVLVLLGINKMWNKPQHLPPPIDNGYTADPDTDKIEEPHEDEIISDEPIFEGLRLEIAVVRGDCWIEVVADDQVVFSRTVKKGEDMLVFEAVKEIRLVLGNAGAVDLIYNGRVLDSLGKIGDVVRPTFTKEGD